MTSQRTIVNCQIPLHRIISEPKRMISRHTSPTYTNGDASGMGIPRNSSPILDPHKKSDVSSSKGSPIAVVADGEVVVFDDSEGWKGDSANLYFSFFFRFFFTVSV